MTSLLITVVGDSSQFAVSLHGTCEMFRFDQFLWPDNYLFNIRFFNIQPYSLKALSRIISEIETVPMELVAYLIDNRQRFYYHMGARQCAHILEKRVSIPVE